MKRIALLLSVLSPLALSSTTAEAQKDRPPPYMAESLLNAAPVAAGVVKRFIINPHGEIDGLLLADGTLAKHPPHMAPELTVVVKPGDTISVRGFREYGGTVKALVVTNEASKRAVIEHPPVRGIWKMPKHLRFAMLSRLQAAGKVERAIYGKKGEVHGVMLDDGTVVRFPKHAVYQFAAQLQPGQTIAVEGLGTQNEYGRALEATAIGTSPQTLQPIYERPIGRAAFAPTPPIPPGGPITAQQQLATTTGTVTRFTLSPRGELDGLILRDGTEVHVPPHLSAQLAAAVRPGDAVTITGYRSPTTAHFIAASVTNIANNQTVVDRGPPPPGYAPPPPRGVPAPGAQSASAQGRVQMLLHGPAGDVNGALLDDGTVLRMPPHVAYQVVSLLTPGQSIAAQGWGINTAYGRVIDVQTIGTSPNQMTPVASPPLAVAPLPPADLSGAPSAPPQPPRP